MRRDHISYALRTFVTKGTILRLSYATFLGWASVDKLVGQGYFWKAEESGRKARTQGKEASGVAQWFLSLDTLESERFSFFFFF